MALRGHNITVAPAEATIRYLICTCGPCLLALPAEWIRGILTEEEAGYATGMTSAGLAYSAISLADHLSIPSGATSVDTRVILCGNGTYIRAFVVDRVIELVDVNRTAIRPLPGHFHGSERTKLSGYLLYGETLVLIVNPAWLMETGTGPDQPRLRTALRQHETSGLPHAHVPDMRSAVG